MRFDALVRCKFHCGMGRYCFDGTRTFQPLSDPPRRTNPFSDRFDRRPEATSAARSCSPEIAEISVTKRKREPVCVIPSSLGDISEICSELFIPAARSPFVAVYYPRKITRERFRPQLAASYGAGRALSLPRLAFRLTIRFREMLRYAISRFTMYLMALSRARSNTLLTPLSRL